MWLHATGCSLGSSGSVSRLCACLVQIIRMVVAIVPVWLWSKKHIFPIRRGPCAIAFIGNLSDKEVTICSSRFELQFKFNRPHFFSSGKWNFTVNRSGTRRHYVTMLQLAGLNSQITSLGIPMHLGDSFLVPRSTSNTYIILSFMDCHVLPNNTTGCTIQSSYLDSSVNSFSVPYRFVKMVCRTKKYKWFRSPIDANLFSLFYIPFCLRRLILRPFH